MKRNENQLIWEAYSEAGSNNQLQDFINKENENFRKTTGYELPAIEKYPIASQVSNDPLIQRYVATRLHYYGGGADKLAAAKQWAAEAQSNPTQLD